MEAAGAGADGAGVGVLEVDDDDDESFEVGVAGEVGELDESKLPHLLELKYRSIYDGIKALGEVSHIRSTFIDFQKHLYGKRAA